MKRPLAYSAAAHLRRCQCTAANSTTTYSKATFAKLKVSVLVQKERGQVASKYQVTAWATLHDTVCFLPSRNVSFGAHEAQWQFAIPVMCPLDYPTAMQRTRCCCHVHGPDNSLKATHSIDERESRCQLYHAADSALDTSPARRDRPAASCTISQVTCPLPEVSIKSNLASISSTMSFGTRPCLIKM